MSKLWLGSRGGAVVVTALCFAACSTDDPGSSGAGSTDGGSAGHSGQGDGGTAATAGSASASGGSAGATDGGNAGEGGGGDGAGEGGAAGSPDPTRVLLSSLSPLPAVPADPTNAFADDPAAAALGQRFFFDEKFSGALKIDSDLGLIGQTAKVSCRSCHGSPFMDDDRSDPATVAIGAGLHTRNSPPLVNSSFYEWTNWGGRFAAQWELPLAVVESGVIMNGNRLALAHRIFDVYKADYEAIFGELAAEIGSDADRFPAAGKPKPAPTVDVPDPPDGAWEDMTDDDRAIVNTVLANYSKAIAAYLRLLVSRQTPFDAFVEGDDQAISESALRGAELFVSSARCSECHSGPHLSDSRFHVLGVPQTGSNVPATDDGRFKDVPALLGSAFNVDGAFSDDPDTGKLDDLTNPMPDSAKGAFRTPSLRGVALTAPYMHSGQLATLEDVIDFYDAGGSDTTGAGQLEPLNLGAQEKTDLIEFLKTLTGDGVAPQLLADTAAP
jgi:cytochrome c peroxidase